MIKYKLSSDRQDVIKYMSDLIISHLESGGSLLWLSSGGSNIDTTVKIASNLAGYDTSKLYFSLVDERYGAVGHPDENWQQLIDAGLNLAGANLYRPIIEAPIDITTKHFSDWLDQKLSSVSYRVGLFGIGGDGHTAGIKPESTAVDSDLTAASYDWDDFRRITITPKAIKKLDEAVISAMGQDKEGTLKQLLTTDTPMQAQPAQVLKQVKKSILFTDYKEEKH